MKSRSSAEKLWLGGTALAGLLIVVIGWFFLVAPERQHTSDVESQIADVDLQNTTLQGRIGQLSAQKAKWKTFAADLAKAHQALPTTNDMSAFLRTIQSVGRATGASVTSLSVGTAAAADPVAPVGGPAPSATPATGAPGSTPGGSGGGILSIPLTASVTGSSTALTKFLTQLQSVQPRAVLVTDITRGSEDGSAGNSMQLTMEAFVAPEPSAPSATPGG